MGYTYGNFQLRNIDAGGNDLLNPTNLTVLPFTPTIVRNTAIGNIVLISFNIDAFGGDKFNSKQIRVNFGTFTGSDFPAAVQYGFESNGFIDAVLQDGFFVGNTLSTASAFLQDNLTARFQRVNANQAYVEIEFYMTSDTLKYIGLGSSGNNFDRFMKALWSGPTLQNGGATVYSIQKELGIKGLVFNTISNFSEVIYNPADGTKRIRIPFESKWYNSDLLGATTGIRYIENLEITSTNQIASGVPYLAKATATTAQGPTQNLDNSVTVQYNSLEYNAKNSVTIRLKGLVNPAVTPNPATTDIRVILIRLNPLTNTSDFITDLQLKDAIIPALAAGTAQIEGAIWTPSLWTDTAPDITDLQFVLDGAYLNNGDTYRIVINAYDSLNSRVTSHISPDLVVNFTPPISPTITGEIGTYNKIFTGNDLDGLAPHSRFKSRITIDKANYNAQLTGFGLSGDFDSAFIRSSVQLLSAAGEPLQEGNYYINTLTPPLDNSILNGGMTIVTDTAAELVLDCYFRVDEEKAGLIGGIVWVVEFNQPTILNSTEQVNIFFIQRTSYRLFENDEGAPKLLSAKVYDFNQYPTNKIEIFDLCDKDYVIVEVEKDAAFTGQINFVATIYPADAVGATVISVIEEEEQWLPAVQILPQLSSTKLDDVDISFSGNFAAFRVNVQQLSNSQLYWITAIAYEQIPSYCPIGLVHTRLEGCRKTD
jgi:hypothetical protein